GRGGGYGDDSIGVSGNAESVAPQLVVDRQFSLARLTPEWEEIRMTAYAYAILKDTVLPILTLSSLAIPASPSGEAGIGSDTSGSTGLGRSNPYKSSGQGQDDDSYRSSGHTGGSGIRDDSYGASGRTDESGMGGNSYGSSGRSGIGGDDSYDSGNARGSTGRGSEYGSGNTSGGGLGTSDNTYSDNAKYGSGTTSGAGYGNKSDKAGDKSSKGDSTSGKLMEKVGSMFKNEKMKEQGHEKRAQAGYGNDGSEGNYGGTDQNNY
ncbi:MAG: hypothetical protein Q9187_006627, partial [Circinaria calcarea]